MPSTFRVQDYSWDDHGFSLVNRLYNDVGHLLDLKFRAAYNLTYFTMADKTNVDTSKFRRAIWNYIQCIYGIRHDDYDYGEVNQVSTGGNPSVCDIPISKINFNFNFIH